MALDENTTQELANLALAMSSNPKTRKAFLKLTKEVNPNTPIPEIDVEDQITARVGEVEKRYEEKFQKLDQDRLKRDWRSNVWMPCKSMVFPTIK